MTLKANSTRYCVYCPEFVNYERVQPDLVRAIAFGEGYIDYRTFFTGLQDGVAGVISHHFFGI